METIGLGANVAAFVVIASQLSQFLFTTFFSIRDAPDNVRRVAGHLLQLHGVLEQLRLSPFACHDTALAGHVGLCISDLNTLADTLRKVQSTPNQSGASMLWKRFKSFLNEEKLQKICEQIIVHTSTLNLRLGVLRSNATQELLSDTRTIAQLINGLNSSVEKQTTNLTSQFGGLDNTLHSHHDEIQTELSSIRAAVQSMSTMSQTNADSMVDLLNELKKIIITPPTPNTRQQEETGDKLEQNCEGGNKQEKTEDNDISGSGHCLNQSITRLCCLVQEKNRTFNTNAEDDTQAEDIIEDLQILVSSAQKYGDITWSTQLSATSDRTVDNKAIRSDLRRFSQAFGQFKLVINEEGRGQNRPPPIPIRQKRRYFKISLGNLGTLSLMTIKRTRAPCLGAVSGETDCQAHTTVLSFLPRNLRQFKIIASISQGDLFPRSMLPISRLAVNRILPASSRVFRVVEHGTLQELQAMLREGEATLRDCDECGDNIIFYAIHNRRIEMLAFLIENGVDVDQVVSVGTNGLLFSLLGRCLSAASLEVDEQYWRIPLCRLLLESGADPTLTGSCSPLFFLKMIATDFHLDVVRSFWTSKYIKLFVSINDPCTPNLRTPILSAMSRLYMGCPLPSHLVERLDVLLDAGASVHIRDRWNRSCMHIFMLNAHEPMRCVAEIRDRFLALKLLVERGADVYAVDRNNRSVSEYAYCPWDCSCAGDLWDAVLQSCGYDIAEFRKICQRRALYNESYTRRHFEILWEGMEDRCPYWDDKPWQPSAPSLLHVLPECTLIEIMGVDLPDELAESYPSQEYGVGGAIQEIEQNRQDESALEAPGACEQGVLKTQSEILRTSGEDTDNERDLAHNQSCQFMGDMDMPALFENPWV